MQVTIDTTAIAGAVGAVVGAATAAITLAVRVIRPVRHHIERFRQFAEDWEGEPGRPGVAERPGMMVRMAAVETEFRPNGGNSMRDRVDAIERRQVAHEGAHVAATAAVAIMTSSDNGGQVAA